MPTPPIVAPVITSAPSPSSPPKATSSPPPPVSEAPPIARQSFAGLRLDEVGAFADLPSEVRDLLTEVARVEDLGPDEETAQFGAVLLLQGDASVCATIVDTPAYRASTGALIAARGTLSEGTKLRVVAGAGGARVAVWNQAVLDMALKSCPWVLDELKIAADRFQALAGATMGPMGELDEATRAKFIDRMTVRVVRPLETIASQGSQLEWLGVIGGGFVDLLKGEPARVTGDVRPGDFVFPVVALRDMPVPTSVRGGPAGAILLVGERSLAAELFGGSPPIIDILGE